MYLSLVMHACVLSCFSSVKLCNPVDCSLAGSSVHGILQAGNWSGLPCPGGSDGKNMPAMHEFSFLDFSPEEGKSERESRSVVSDSLQPHGLYSPCNSPGQNTGVGSHALLQGIFPTQGSKSRSPAGSFFTS